MLTAPYVSAPEYLRISHQRVALSSSTAKLTLQLVFGVNARAAQVRSLFWVVVTLSVVVYVAS